MIQLNELIDESHGSLITEKRDVTIEGVSIDTRTIRVGDCFFALRGHRFDGHTFLLKAYEQGAVAFIIDYSFLSTALENDNEEYANAIKQLPNVIAVQDTIKSLGYCASYFRKKYAGSCVGITGSCGKTTTKELCTLLLQSTYSVTSNPGNFNNHIGVPLTLFNFDPTNAILVCEMGASAPGDIRYLSNMVQPEVGIITNVYPAHLEGFKSVENVYRTKLELAEYLDTVSGALIINGDDERLVQEARNYNLTLVTFGKSPHCDFVLTRVDYNEGALDCEVNGKFTFTLNTIGHFNALNALAAIALADFYKIEFSKLTDVFSQYVDLEGRFKIKKGDALIIDDTYNANPFSFSQSLDIFKRIKTQRKKIVVCGDMLELGSESEQFHRKLGHDIISSGAGIVVAVGHEIRATVDAIEKSNAAIRCIYCEGTDAAIHFLKDEVGKGDAVLLKGSRGIKLDEVVRAL